MHGHSTVILVLLTDFITVHSNPLVPKMLEVVGHEFCLFCLATSNQCRQNPAWGMPLFWILRANLHDEMVNDFVDLYGIASQCNVTQANKTVVCSG
jgi:hypothetical protein